MGHNTITTPKKPKVTVIKRNARTVSPKIIAAKIVSTRGVVKPNAVTSENVSTPIAKKRNDIASAPEKPRQIWPEIFEVRKVVRRSPRAANQPITTNIEKKAR